MKFSNLYFVALFSLTLFILSCNNSKEANEGALGNNENVSQKLRSDFTEEEIGLIETSNEIIESSYYCTLVTIDKEGQPKVRVMEPFKPDDNYEIWLATNPKSRKVQQIKNNSKSTVNYFNKTELSYVSLMGNAFIVNDETIKSQKWKEGWEQHYKNKKEDYLLIRFVPESLELVSYTKGYTGDKITWAPDQVQLRD
ncbi:MAG: pyridoxamine 5'-phosphate oxidase family protein [Aureibaculum sp.]|nr:pyridoxamine 5'-phosphate oxidase family protein [Aureibaculum sp.]